MNPVHMHCMMIHEWRLMMYQVHIVHMMMQPVRLDRCLEGNPSTSMTC
jgi:hypothetical protein